MKYPIVIASAYHMAEYVCKQILGINPKDHAMSAHTASRQGLRGYDKPVVILYCEDQPDIWIIEDLILIREHLEISNATVIHLPEVTRVSRPVRLV